ncbi:MAG: thiamine pyrophosphate-binding protein [Eubacterium sp.]|nr:thiamine pyrophosphate-binding protein [Eubacterium sp.]
MIRVVDYIVKRLKEQGIDHVFFVPGVGCMYLTDALAKDKEITAVSVHHEQAAAMAALAYAQQKEGLGACFLTTGCGGTNAITGVLHAWQDGIPCIIISGQVKQEDSIDGCGADVRQVGRQEADVYPMIKGITKYASVVRNASQIGAEMDKAIYHSVNGRQGPSWLILPLDVQAGMVDEDSLDSWRPETKPEDTVDRDAEEISEWIRSVSRPLLLVGSGIRAAGAVGILQSFLDKTGMPVVCARTGVDLIDGDRAYAIGVTGTLGVNRAANFAVANCDLLLVVGHRMSRDTVGDANKYAREARICMIDIDPEEMNKNTIRVDKKICADAGSFLHKLSERVSSDDIDKNWKDKCMHWKCVFPKKDALCVSEEKSVPDLYTFLDALSKVMPEKTTLLSDAGSVWQLVPSVVGYDGMTQRSIHAYAQGEMGFSIPGGIGAAYANPDGVTVAITGDGSAMMNIQELATIHHRSIPVKIIVINNKGYATIKTTQKDAFRRTIGTGLEDGLGMPEYSCLAEAFGICYMSIDTTDHLEESIREVLDTEGPVLCEVFCEDRTRTLMTSFAMTKERRMVMRPIEDLSPFLDRELFLSEMIIDPIDQ